MVACGGLFAGGWLGVFGFVFWFRLVGGLVFLGWLYLITVVCYVIAGCDGFGWVGLVCC